MTEGGKPSPEAAPSVTGAAAAPPQAAQATVEDFKKLVFKVGVIVGAEDHPNADRLLVLKVDIGDGTPRQVVAGIKGSYQAAELVGQHVVVVANLKPAQLRGVESQGMVLAASDGSAMVLVSPGKPIAAGSHVK
jgi:methionyl-tRNA synthetase